jgi:hypothetical protein
VNWSQSNLRLLFRHLPMETISGSFISNLFNKSFICYMFIFANIKKGIVWNVIVLKFKRFPNFT